MRACSMLRASHQVLVGEHRNTFSLSGRAKTKERRKRHNSSVSTADREPVRRVGASCARQVRSSMPRDDMGWTMQVEPPACSYDLA